MNTRKNTPVLMALLLGLLLPAQAKASRQSSDVIIYSYEKTYRDGKRFRMLMPRLTIVKGSTGSWGTGAAAVFDKLLRDKPRLYGRTRLQVGSRSMAQSRIVTVRIDPRREDVQERILAELVYTLTEYGAKGIRATLPNGTTKLFNRKNVRVPVYVLHLPMWAALPPTPFKSGIVQMNGGGLTSLGVFQRQARRGKRDVVKFVISLLSHENVKRRLKALRALAVVPVPRAHKYLIPLLKDPDVRIRLASLSGLKGKRSPKVMRLLRERLSQDPSDDVRFAAARALIDSGNNRAMLDGLTYFLNSSDTERKIRAIADLRKVKIPGMTRRLLPLLRDPIASVRQAALNALAGRSDRNILQAILERLDRDRDKGVRDTAAEALIALGDKFYAPRGYRYQLRRASTAQAVVAIRKLTTLMGTGALLDLTDSLSDRRKAVRDAAIAQMGRLNDPAAIPALTKLIRRQDNPKAQAVLSKIMAAQPMSRLISWFNNSSKTLRSMSLKALSRALEGKSAPPEVYPALISLLRDQDMEIRGLAIGTLIKIGGPKAAQGLARALRDRKARIRLKIARAMARIPCKASTEGLLELLEDEDDAVRLAALRGLGTLKEKRVLPKLTRMTKYGNIKVRREVMKAIARIVDQTPDYMVSTLIDVLFDEDAACREYAVEALKTSKSRRAYVNIILLLRDSAARVRAATVRALGYQRRRRVTRHITNALEDKSAIVRLAAIQAIARRRDKRALYDLEKLLRNEPDSAVLSAARRVLKALKR